MDARAYVRISVGSLGLRVSKTSGTGYQACAFPCLCEIRLHNFPIQTASVPIVSTGPVPHSIAANFYLDETALRKLLQRTWFGISSPCLEIVVFTGREGLSCGLYSGKQLGSFRIRVSSEWIEGRAAEIFRGWTSIGKTKADRGKPGTEFHVVVKVEPDPRLVFQFDGEPALSPQIIQTQGTSRQPVFSCKFSRDRGARCGLDDGLKGWATRSGVDKEKERKGRKGWLVMIHDLSGSPAAAASIVTPFVPSAGSNHVSRLNPGAWLILRPESGAINTWSPWGRLEAWREQGVKGGLGCRFQLVAEGGVTGASDGILISETIISTQKGGEFLIDTTRVRSAASSPIDSPQSSGDFTFNLALSNMNGFVMSCSIERKGRNSNKLVKPVVQLAVRHVSCLEDAAVFMALAAAVDLSMDACQSFSKKLRKELSDTVPSM